MDDEFFAIIMLTALPERYHENVVAALLKEDSRLVHGSTSTKALNGPTEPTCSSCEEKAITHVLQNVRARSECK